MPNSVVRVERFRLAILAIETRGERPTSRAVLREIGGYHNMIDNGYGKVIDNGMSGQDLLLFEKAMKTCGYERVPVGDKPWNKRWAKREATNA